ncbi:hypothetical protein [Streptomyces hainanensis]|uniref:Uncharacterized protein n=1 Tax=Streptomyces hainanensis TaxID=402648 RepID=A0A4R4SJR7_9ACTN|nr:hypothetical protein [Streptomyces hainanensis]TDC63858.1 hypothetical protein E1283_32035 [Streptomyces hainanensis]
MTPPALPPFPVVPPALGPAHHTEVMADRAVAINTLLRADFSAGQLAWKGFAVVTCSVAAMMASAGWTETGAEDGDEAVGVAMLFLGALALAIALFLLARGAIAQQARNRLLLAWFRLPTHPALRNLPEPAPHPAGPLAGRPVLPSPFTERRFPWAALSAVSLLFGVAFAWQALTTGSGDDAGTGDPMEDWIMPLAGAVPLLCGGVAGGWKAIRPTLLARGSGWLGPGPTDSLVAPRQGWRTGTRLEIPDVLRRVRPGGPFDRWHRSVATGVFATLVAVPAAVVSLMLGGQLGRPALLVAIPLAVLLLHALLCYDLRWWFYLPGMLGAVALLAVGLPYEQARVLDARGEWTRAVVVSAETSTVRSSTTTSCRLETPDGDPLPGRLGGCTSLLVGDEIRVLTDPEGRVGPSQTAPDPTGWHVAQGLFGVALTGALTAAAVSGHRYRRDRPPSPVAPRG